MFEVQRDLEGPLTIDVARRLAAALVSRLAKLVPQGISILMDDARIALARGNEILAKADLEPILDQAGDVRDLVVMALTNALSTIQDFVAEELTIPWPAAGSGRSAPTLPLPDVSMDSMNIRLWFGDEASPVLELQPIPLEEIGLGRT